MRLKKILKYLIKRILIIIYRIMAVVFPIRKNTVVFNSNIGKNYSGNPRAIFEEMLHQKLTAKFKCIWFFTDRYLSDETAAIPAGAECIHYGHPKYYYYMAVAGVWIFDSRQEDYLVKRRDVRYLQTWHGTPLKKLALDITELRMAGEDNLENYRKRFINNTSSWDYLIVQNEFAADTFKRCFAFGGRILETGYPRNDILFNYKCKPEDMTERITVLKEKLSIPEDKKIMLYAPTWRDDCLRENGWYGFVTKLDFSSMQKSFDDEFILIVKYHYLVTKENENNEQNNFIRICDNETDIAELYLISDILITDYSSVMFDYCILGRPIFFYTFDLESYRDSLRGFYFDLLKEAPGPVVTSTEELIESINKYNMEMYHEKYTAFVKKYNTFEKGNASKKVIKELFGDINME